MSERVLHDNEAHRLVARGGVLLSINFEPPRAEGTQRVADAVRALAEQSSGGVSLIIVPSAPRPGLSPGAGNAIRRAWADVGAHLRCVAVWIRRDGFGGAIVRSLATGVLLLDRPTFPVSMVASAEEAARLVARYDPRADRDELRAWLDLQARHDAPG